MAVAILAGLIGLGGAEFRLPILIAIFALYPHRAIRINLLISFLALAMSAVSRLSFLHSVDLTSHTVEIIGMLAGGVAAAWFGASALSRIPKTRHIGVIAVLQLATATLLAAETTISGAAWNLLGDDSHIARARRDRGRASCRHHQQHAWRCRRRVHHSDPHLRLWR